VIFTDKSRVQFNTKKKKIWISKDSTSEPVEQNRRQIFVLIWGATKYGEVSMLELVEGTMTALKYLNILKRRLLKNHDSSPLNTESDSLIYHHDNLKPHKANDVKRYFEERNIYVLSWPLKSPDLNLIESVWARLKASLKRSYQNQQDLEEDIINAWNSMPCDFVVNLYASKKDRIQAVIDKEGGQLITREK